MTTKEDYIKRVLLIMNEAGLMDAVGNSSLGADTAQVDRYIEGSYVDAWRQCVKVMPRNWFANFELAETQFTPLTPNLADGTGYIILPADFYLLSYFKMEGWKKPVYEAYIDNDKTSSIQTNEFTRGSVIRPVCTIGLEIYSMEARSALYYYSLPKGLKTHKIEKAFYVPVAEPILDKNSDFILELNDQILEPMAYLSAATVFTMFEKYDISNAIQARAIAMFPGLQSVRGTSVTTKQ